MNRKRHAIKTINYSMMNNADRMIVPWYIYSVSERIISTETLI